MSRGAQSALIEGSLSLVDIDVIDRFLVTTAGSLEMADENAEALLAEGSRK